MYAVVSSGGKQYRVEAGNELILERVAGDDGGSITFDRVLLVGDGEAVTVGTPTVEGATVRGTVLGEALGPKLIVFKFKQKATYRRKNGHRQHLTRVRIDEINTRDGAVRREQRTATGGDEDAAATATPSEARRSSRPTAPKPDAAASGAAADDAVKPRRTRKPAADKAEAEE